MPNSIRKQQILNVTANQFREKGFVASSMRDLASEIGIEAASLYYHFSSKDELLETICFGMIEKYLNAINEVNDIYFNAEEKLRMAINSHVHLLTEYRDQSVVCLNESRNLKEPHLTRYANLRAGYIEQFRAIIVQGINEDIFGEVDLEFAILFILSSINWIHHWFDAKEGMCPDEVATRISNFILNGLRKKMVTDINN